MMHSYFQWRNVFLDVKNDQTVFNFLMQCLLVNLLFIFHVWEMFLRIIDMNDMKFENSNTELLSQAERKKKFLF